ncbi:MAG: homocysteine S-methyltransferase family protein [Treponema sp.]|nr:homocysteine S-methyltransferase family protein [Treponema sp.]
MRDVRKYLGKRILFCDGGTGSVLQEMGLQPGELPENWNIEHSENIVELNYSYFKSGSNIVNTNTFGAFATKFSGIQSYRLEEIIEAAVKNANAARDKIEKENSDPHFIAFDIGSCGKLLKPLGDLSFDDAVLLFKKSFRIALAQDIDLILIETMNDVYEAKAAVIAAKEAMAETEVELPIFVTTVYDQDAKSLTGSSPEVMVAVLEGLGVTALGMNCSLGPEQMKPIVSRLTNAASLPVIVNPNAGLPRSENGKTVYDVSPERFAEIVSSFCEDGALVVGGCCGTTPEHIRLLVEKVRELENEGKIRPEYPEDKNVTAITSCSRYVEFGKSPVLIGERINPTGKKRFKEALRQNDIPYILNEGITQEAKGAQVLDVNVGLPEIDEVAMMETVVKELQGITELPLQLDTSDPVAMEKALRIYNGKPLVNSVNGKEEVMKAVFPLVKKYGGLVVALTLDEGGIPETSEGRIAIVEKIYKRAADFGIARKNIIIDPLAMAVSSDDKAALATLETVKYVKHVKNGNTILGVSNISFGLPLREIVTATFFTMAMQNGLSAAIMNPNSLEMMKAWTCFCMLSGYDAQCLRYISFAEKYSELQAQVSPAQNQGQKSDGAKKDSAPDESSGLKYAIIKGMKDNSRKEASILLETMDSLTVINSYIIPALDVVGKGFEEKKVYLPQLLMSAESAKYAFDVIKEKLEASGKVEEPKGSVVVATVKGDIHDIGKNIVKVLLENYSFKVIDLGKDVAPERIVDEVVAKKIRLVGLSALMTTTVPSMAETIKQLREKAPWCKVCVGGAVLTQEYADMIGADFYGKDAMETVKYAQKVFESPL